MTAYQLTPVGPNGAEEHRAVRIKVRSYAELLADNERLETLWRQEADLRVRTQERLNRASRVLASLGRLSPQMARLVEAARREVWGDLR